jgi:hypothetical protein
MVLGLAGAAGLAMGRTAGSPDPARFNGFDLTGALIPVDAIAVTYFPLCGTGMAFDTRLQTHTGMRELSLGISGLLFNSDLAVQPRESVPPVAAAPAGGFRPTGGHKTEGGAT